jgi:hypothetical protein
LIIFDNLNSLKNLVYHIIKSSIVHFVIKATFLIALVQYLSASAWIIPDKMSIVEMKESIYNEPIVLIFVVHLYGRFLIFDDEGYTKLSNSLKKFYI